MIWMALIVFAVAFLATIIGIEVEKDSLFYGGLGILYALAGCFLIYLISQIDFGF